MATLSRFIDNPVVRAQPDPRGEPAEAPQDRDLEDLIYSWRRLKDPHLRRLAIGLVRTLGAERT